MGSTSALPTQAQSSRDAGSLSKHTQSWGAGGAGKWGALIEVVSFINGEW